MVSRKQLTKFIRCMGYAVEMGLISHAVYHYTEAKLKELENQLRELIDYEPKNLTEVLQLAWDYGLVAQKEYLELQDTMQRIQTLAEDAQNRWLTEETSLLA